MPENISVENFNKFISIAARRIDKSEWYKLPARTREVFYKYKDINRWISKASDTDKMFFLEDIGFTTARVVFPNNQFDVSDIPELSDFTIDIKNRIKSIEKMVDKDFFCLCTRELAVYFYNMSQNSNSRYYALQSDMKSLQVANEKYQSGAYESAIDYQKTIDTREGILKFINNILISLNESELSLQEIIILSSLREYNDVGIKTEGIKDIFHGSVGNRMIQIYLQNLNKKGLIVRSGKKNSTIYTLSAKGMLYINDYADKMLSL